MASTVPFQSTSNFTSGGSGLGCDTLHYSIHHASPRRALVPSSRIAFHAYRCTVIYRCNFVAVRCKIADWPCVIFSPSSVISSLCSNHQYPMFAFSADL